MAPCFGRSPTWLSRVFNGVLHYLWNKFSSRILMDTSVLLTKENIDQYYNVIADSFGADKGQIFGFIDGTDIDICRPGEYDQQLFYSGHHKSHTVTYLCIMLPNGMFGAVLDRLPGAGGDAYAYGEVELGKKLLSLNASFCYTDVAQRRYVYGDAAFGSQDCVFGPYKRSNAEFGDSEKTLNHWMPKKRVCVEHGFSLLKSQLEICTQRTLWKAGSQPIGLHLPVRSFLINYRTFMRGRNQISKYFDLKPMSLDGYLELNNEDLGDGGDMEDGVEN